MSAFLWGVPAVPDSSLLYCRFFIFRIMENAKTVSPSSLWVHSNSPGALLAWRWDSIQRWHRLWQKWNCIHYRATYQNQYYFNFPFIFPLLHTRNACWLFNTGTGNFFLTLFFNLIFISSNCKAACFPQAACCDWFSVFLWIEGSVQFPSLLSLFPALMSELLWGAQVMHDLFTHLHFTFQFTQLF